MTNFFDFMKSFTDMNMMSKMMPMDMNSMVSAQKKNAEMGTKMLSEIGQIGMEAAKTVISRSSEMIHNAGSEVMDFMKGSMTASTPELAMNKQHVFAKSCMENAISNVEEMGEIITKSGKDMYKISKKMIENINDCCAHAPHTSKKKAA